MVIDTFLVWHAIIVVFSLAAAAVALWPKLFRNKIHPSTVLSVGFGVSLVMLFIAELFGYRPDPTGSPSMILFEYDKTFGVTAFSIFLAAFIPFMYWLSREKTARKRIHMPNKEVATSNCA